MSLSRSSGLYFGRPDDILVTASTIDSFGQNFLTIKLQTPIMLANSEEDAYISLDYVHGSFDRNDYFIADGILQVTCDQVEPYASGTQEKYGTVNTRRVIYHGGLYYYAAQDIQYYTMCDNLFNSPRFYKLARTVNDYIDRITLRFINLPNPRQVQIAAGIRLTKGKTRPFPTEYTKRIR